MELSTARPVVISQIGKRGPFWIETQGVLVRFCGRSIRSMDSSRWKASAALYVISAGGTRNFQLLLLAKDTLWSRWNDRNPLGISPAHIDMAIFTRQFTSCSGLLLSSYRVISP